MRAYENLKPYFGDLHNHCAVGYGHGSLEDAFRNARMQLDFAAVTVHAHWPDIPEDEPRLKALVAYHKRGFQKSDQAWKQVQEAVEANYHPGKFVTFLAYEWHSNQYGDHNIYFNGTQGEIIRAANLEELRAALRTWREKGIDTMAIPHHIGYKQGYRGINWGTFNPEVSPVVEIMSMHGASESPDAPYPYLHTMGPRDWQSTYQYGLAQGHIVGAIGSTDHHSAHPGSYGHGCMAVWAESLDREAIWQAIKARRTYALTGDKIALSFSVNNGVMGSILPPARERIIECHVRGGGAIDYIDLVHNNRLIHRENTYKHLSKIQSEPFENPVKVHLELGWGQKAENVDWQGELEIMQGRLLDIEPRFRGHDVVAPQADEEESYRFSDWERISENGVRFTTRTWGNPGTTTTGTQGLAFEMAGSANTSIRGTINGQDVEVSLSELIAGPKSGYLGGFLTPAYCFHRAVPEIEYASSINIAHQAETHSRDWYYVLVRQHNGQWVWSSPIWVEGNT